MAKRKKTTTTRRRKVTKGTSARRPTAGVAKDVTIGYGGRGDTNAKSLLMSVMPKGQTGLKRTGGFVFDEWHPKLQGTTAIKVYREMSDNDPVIGSFLYALGSYLRSAEIKIEAADDSPLAEQIAEHIRTCLDDMSMATRELIGDILSMAWAGFSWHEVVYKIRQGPDAELPMLRSKYRDGLVGWRKMPIRAQDTIWEWEFAGDGGITAAFQQAAPHYKRTRLPIENSLLFRPSWNKNSPEGRSLLRNAYRSWYFLKKIQELEAIGIERDMAGMLVFHLPIEYFAENATQDQQDTIADYRRVQERARRGEQEGLVFPAEEEEDGKTGFQARLLQSGGRRPMDTDGIIKRLESRIAISVLGEAVLLGMQGNVGSWALSSSKTHMMAVGIKGIMDSIADVMTRFAIPRLVKLNRWPMELSPRWVFSDIESDAAPELMQSLAAGVGAGLVTPDPAIEEYLRIRMGLPEAEELDLSNGATQDALERMSEEPENSEAALQAAVPIAAQENSPTAALSVDQAAEQLGVNRNVIMGALRRGQLPGARIGGSWRIMREDLVEYMRGPARAA